MHVYGACMTRPTEAERCGLDYRESITALLDNIRCAHPTSGLFDAAEVQWWWAQNERTTDDFDQLFWVDEQGRPEAAVIATNFGDSTQLDPFVLPGASPEWRTTVMHRGLQHAHKAGFDQVYLEVDRGDEVLPQVLTERGFAVEEAGMVESWMDADSRPPISSLPDGYELLDRGATKHRPHHMINEGRGHTDREPRLAQTSLYRPEFDLAIYAPSGEVAGYGLFWLNPATQVGVLEPMRTEDDHQQRGVARHLLTSGIDRLASAGATRIKVVFGPGNPAAKHLSLSSGFEPHRENDLYSGPTSA
jgi:GNAT superfamily N-acetyltransferase